jgi:hypothetical protein
METITTKFENDFARVEIEGEELNRKYKVQFFDTQNNNELIYETEITQNYWAQTSLKADYIKIYDENEELIYEEYGVEPF